MRRALTIVAQQLRTSLQLAVQYRLDFFLGAGMALFWTAWNVIPLVLVFRHRPEVAGWNLPEGMLVIAFFMILKAALDGAVSPNLVAVVEHIRQGTLDFVLVKPADAQLLVSTSHFTFPRLIDASAGIALAVWSCVRLGVAPTVAQLAACALMLAAATAILYSLWLLVISLAFWFVRVDNLSYFFNALFDAARWPVAVFRGWVRFLLTFVVPVALMTSYPAMALLGTLSTRGLAAAVVLAIVFLAGSRLVWLRAVRHYASASS